MTKPDDEITVVQVQGITKVSKKTMSVEEYLIPKPPPGNVVLYSIDNNFLSLDERMAP